MELSVIRSAISFDSPRDSINDGSVREGELVMEVERLMRRNSLLEKSKQVLEEEMQLFREEIQSKNRRIQQLTQKINKSSSFAPLPSPCQTQKYDHSHLEVILLEKEEQINLIADQLRAKRKRLEELQEENEQLRNELANRNNVVKQLKDSSRAQLSYQQSQIASLEQELQDKNKEITAMKVFHENLAQKQSNKWQKLNDNLKQQLRMVQQEKNGIVLKESNLATQREQLKQKNEELLQEISNLNQNISFLKSLLEEAKGEFINVQIKQQEQLQKEEKEKRQYIKRNKLLKTQIKGLKMDSGNNSTCEPSNKSTRTPSVISITPFRTSSGRSKPIEE